MIDYPQYDSTSSHSSVHLALFEMLISSGDRTDAPFEGSPAESVPPWMHPDAFPEPPVPGTFGYRRQKWTYDCARERLIQRLEEDKDKRISLVWTPESVRLTVPEEHPWLTEAVREREAAHLRKARGSGFRNTVLWGLLALLNGVRSARIAQFHILTMCFLGVIPFLESYWNLFRLRSFTAETMTGRIADARYGAWMERRSTPWTWVLLACVGSVAFVQYLILPWMSVNPLDSPIHAAGIIKDAVRAGEWWRLFTGAFLHAHPLHLIFNLTALISLSAIVEATFHRTLVPLVFIVAAFTGSLFSLVFLPHTDSVGSSGGIMGLLGFALVSTWLQLQYFPAALRRSLALSVAVIAAMGIVAYELIDNAAHAGGLIAGAALAFAIARHRPTHCTICIPRWAKIASIFAWCVIAATTLTCLYKLFSHSGKH